MKANHNTGRSPLAPLATVSYGSKILKWKQITTYDLIQAYCKDCFLWFKDTKMKANHNVIVYAILDSPTVSYGSKILKWKQITTIGWILTAWMNCFLWFKDTKMKANHNLQWPTARNIGTVSYGSKILKWKQITTRSRQQCKMPQLFPMVQRY